MISSKAALGIAAGVCGTLFLGYCIYFDHRRHADPDFKKKLRERECLHVPLAVLCFVQVVVFQGGEQRKRLQVQADVPRPTSQT